MAETWQSVAARKQQQRKSRIPPQWRLKSINPTTATSLLDIPRTSGLLTDQELHLTENYDATDLVSKLAERTLTSEEVVLAFCKRAAIAQQTTNCLTEIFFQDALARAKQLDAHITRTGKPLGPLHGLPISLKDTFNVSGYDSSLGIARFCFQPAESNSALVDVLLSLGAVLYCKTNVPQTMMALDSHNNIFGRTLNPANTRLTAGGSSGGEGALLAMRGSILGVGTDVGGSIRVPAACNGLYGLKPSHGRVPYAGQKGGQEPGSSKLALEATAGPISHSVRDCSLFLRAVSDSGGAQHDPDVLFQPWATQLSLPPQCPLRVGIISSDGHVMPLPPIQRLTAQITQTLQGAPQQAISVFPVDASAILRDAVKTFNGLASLDGGAAWFAHLRAHDEPLSPWLATRLKERSGKTVSQILSLQAARSDLQTRFLALWRETGADVLLFPVAPHPTPAVDRWNTANYTAAWNLLDLPAGVIPVRAVEREDLEGEMDGNAEKAMNGWDKVNRELWAGSVGEREVYLGGTLCVQVVAPRLMERKLVEAMGVLEEALRPLRQGEGPRKSRL